MTNVPDGIYGILICLDTCDVGDTWYQIVLHEMSHIFCLVNEIDGENFQVKYSKENLGANKQYWFSSIGYAIWREFIADYIASQINPFVRPLSLSNLRAVVRELDEGINIDNPERAQDFSLIMSYIFLNSKIQSAPNVDSVFQVLEKNRVFATKARFGEYRLIIDAIWGQLRQESFWKIMPEFVQKIGDMYLGLINR